MPTRKTEHSGSAPSDGSVKKHRIFTTSFASVYPLYVLKAEKKGRTREEVDEIIRWLTGYSQDALAAQVERKTDFETFFASARRWEHGLEGHHSLRHSGFRALGRLG